MIENRMQLLGIAAAVMVAWIVSCNLIVDSVRQAQQPRKADATSLAPAAQTAEVRAALAGMPLEKPYVYAGGFECPFRAYGAGPSNDRPVHAPARRPVFALKAILTKGHPQAILEDDQGATFICGAGDSVRNQRVVSIGERGVTLRDRQGTYEIPVRQ
jgi:hypothetical protein